MKFHDTLQEPKRRRRRPPPSEYQRERSEDFRQKKTPRYVCIIFLM